MSTVTFSDKGQVVIPAAIRHRLGIAPGTKLDCELEGETIPVRPLRAFQRTRPEDGCGMLKCDQPGERRLADFDVTTAKPLFPPRSASFKKRVLDQLCSRASIITLVLIGFFTTSAFALPRDPTWGDPLETGAFALDNRRGPNPVYRFAPVNPGIGSPGGRLESDGGSATGNYHLAIPLLDFPGRGLNLSLTAHYNSQIWSKSSKPGGGEIPVLLRGRRGLASSGLEFRFWEISIPAQLHVYRA